MWRTDLRSVFLVLAYPKFETPKPSPSRARPKDSVELTTYLKAFAQGSLDPAAAGLGMTGKFDMSKNIRRRRLSFFSTNSERYEAENRSLRR